MGYPKNIAHRGASKAAPENTMPAFREALKAGCDGIELDVQLSADGRLMVMHDERLDRTTNMKGLLCRYNYDELKKADAGAWFSDEFADAEIPGLDEVFELLAGTDILLNIELKTGVIPYRGIERKVIEMIDLYDYSEKTVISSFNHYSLAICKQINPKIKTGILYVSNLYKPWSYAATIPADCLHMQYEVMLSAEEDVLAELRDCGLDINVYTVDDPADMSALIERGVTGIITNVPEVLRHRINDISVK